MKLSPEQLEQFEREGYLFFPGLFSPEEMQVIREQVAVMYKESRTEIIGEKDSVAHGTAYPAHN